MGIYIFYIVKIAAVLLLMVGVVLLLDFSHKRPVLWLLAVAAVVTMGIWRGGKRLLAAQGLQFRPWLYSTLFILAGLAGAALFLWIICEVYEKEDATLALKVWVSSLGVLVLLCGGIITMFLLGFRLHREYSGEWCGQKVVMVDIGGRFYYYEYQNLFLMGESFGCSTEAWEEP